MSLYSLRDKDEGGKGEGGSHSDSLAFFSSKESYGQTFSSLSSSASVCRKGPSKDTGLGLASLVGTSSPGEQQALQLSRYFPSKAWATLGSPYKSKLRGWAVEFSSEGQPLPSHRSGLDLRLPTCQFQNNLVSVSHPDHL